MPIHVLMVTPAPRKSGGVLPGKLDARLGERPIVEASRTPLCDGARALLAQGLAAPGDMLVMRHAGSDHDALKAADQRRQTAFQGLASQSEGPSWCGGGLTLRPAEGGGRVSFLASRRS
jgi:hypothetical protein